MEWFVWSFLLVNWGRRLSLIFLISNYSCFCFLLLWVHFILHFIQNVTSVTTISRHFGIKKEFYGSVACCSGGPGGRARQGIAVGWKCRPWTKGYQLFATRGKFFAMFFCCFIFLAKEVSPRIWAEHKLGLCNTLESLIFSYPHIIHSILKTWIMKKSSQILYHVIPRGKFCHTRKTGLSTRLVPALTMTF